MRHVDYIIVGFGIAGAAMSLELRKRGGSVIVFDEPYAQQASRVAAGLFNPITGKVMNKTWNAPRLFPYLHQFYRDAEKLTDSRFFFPTPICIPFLSVEEQNNWAIKSGLEAFVEEVYTGSRYPQFINDQLGGVILKGSGYVDTVKYLDSVKQFIQGDHSYHQSIFRHEDLSIHPDKVLYGEYEAKAIIFCEGTAVLSNPLFKWVPVNPLKGETLQIELSEKLPLIFNRGVYVVPQADGTYRVGSTYSRETSQGTTETGKKELTEKLAALLAPGLSGYKITHQNWGIRPTSPDRRPIIGAHPAYKNVLIFNGMGTKGVSLAPWSAGMLADHLFGGTQIESDLNITRFYALYSKFRD